MPQHVRAPDGSLVAFPDGMGDDQIAAVMRREYGGPDTRPKSFTAGFGHAATKALDRAAMGLEAGAKAVGVPTGKINAYLGTPSAAEVSERHENAYASAPKRGSTAGEIAGAYAAGLPLMAITKNPAALGALGGALTGNATDAGGVLAEAGMGAALGHVGGKVVDTVADAIAPVVRPAVERLQRAGVKMTPGQLKGGKAMAREDKRMSRPFVGDAIAAARQQSMDGFNLGAVNEALAPLGVKVPSPIRPGHDAVDWAHQTVSQAYDQIVPHLAVRLDGAALAQRLQPIVDTLGPAEKKKLGTILMAKLRNGRLVSGGLKNAQSEIRRLGRNYSSDASADNREIGRALGEVDDFLWEQMSAQNPRYAPELQKVNTAFRGLATVESAAKGADGGVFSTGQLKTAVRQGDGSARKNATARGQSYMQDYSEAARDVLPSKTPDSGTAGRSANVLAHIVGAGDLLRFKAEMADAALRQLPRSPGAKRLAGGVRRLKGPVAGGLVAAANGSGD